MPPKTVTCSLCNQEVSKRKTRLVNDKRICKEHDDAKEFAEKDRVAQINKACSDRAAVINKATRHYDHRPYNGGPNLAVLAMLGSLHQKMEEERKEKNEQAKEMLGLSFKRKIYEIFMKHAAILTDSDKLREAVRNDWCEIYVTILDDTDANTRIVIESIAYVHTTGLIDELVDRLDKSILSIKEMVDEWKACSAKHDELFEILNQK